MYSSPEAKETTKTLNEYLFRILGGEKLDEGVKVQDLDIYAKCKQLPEYEKKYLALQKEKSISGHSLNTNKLNSDTKDTNNNNNYYNNGINLINGNQGNKSTSSKGSKLSEEKEAILRQMVRNHIKTNGIKITRRVIENNGKLIVTDNFSEVAREVKKEILQKLNDNNNKVRTPEDDKKIKITNDSIPLEVKKFNLTQSLLKPESTDINILCPFHFKPRWLGQEANGFPIC